MAVNNNNAAITITNRMMELSNKAKFDMEFSRNPCDTLEFIFAAKQFLKVNTFKDESVKFMRIFNVFDYDIKSDFMNEYGDDSDDDIDVKDNDKADQMIVKNIYKYLLDRYTPSVSKHIFVIRLKSDIQRRNEDPSLVYLRYKIKLKKIKNSIKIMNKYRINNIEKIRTETQLEALKGIFIRKNNNKKYNNTGKINELTFKYIVDKNPKTVNDWDELFDGIKTDLISDMFDGMKEYEYQSYAVNEKDLDVHSHRKRYRNDSDNDDELPYEKRRRLGNW